MDDIKWKDITREERPWNWRASLNRFCITAKSFNDFIGGYIEKMHEEMDKRKENKNK